MAFDLNSIPSTVLNLFKGGSTLFLAVSAAATVGINSSNTLTDIVFFLRYPERGGKPLTKNDTALIKEWLEIQREIENILSRIAINDSPSGTGPLWMQYANQERKRWESIVETEVDIDEQYFMASPFFGATRHTDGQAARDGTNIHWCAAFVNWCLHRSGYSHTGNGSNESFRKRSKWHFNALKEPKKGCVILLGHSKNGTRSNHVAFLDSWKKLPSGSNEIGDTWISGAKRLKLLGGNQGDRVKVKNYYEKKIYAAKGLNGVTSPYLWPLRGPDTCSIASVPTKSGHFCGCNPAAA